jgi:hypothetical protein
MDLFTIIACAVSGFLLGFMLAKAVKQAPAVGSKNTNKEILHHAFGLDKPENTCRMFVDCGNLINSGCISGQCNMHCRIYCKCGASDNPPRKEDWADVIDYKPYKDYDNE